MLSLFLVASFVLPTVLGHCCLPDKIDGIAYDAGNPVVMRVVADFTQMKYIVVPDSGLVSFVLDDLSAGKKYIKYSDGSCVIDSTPVQFTQCFTKGFNKIGDATLGNGMAVTTYGLKVDDDVVLATLTTDECLPVLNIRTIDGETTTRIYANVTTTVTDLSDLNQDLSECKEEV